MSNWKNKLLNAGYVKPVFTTVSVTGLGWLLHEVYATYNTLKTIGHVEIRSFGNKYIHINSKETKGLIVGKEGYMEHQLGRRRFIAWLHRTRYWMVWRLLHLAQSLEPQTRTEAVFRLAALQQSLSESDLTQIAQACDAHTAVGLARCRGIRKGYFLQPPSLYRTTDHEELIEEMRDVLYKLNQESKHLCVKYFLSKAFPEYEKKSNYLLDAEVMLTEPWTILTSKDNLLPLCVQALDHHISTINTEIEFVKLGGLPMLMAVYQELKSNANISKMVCRIISRISSHPEYLPQLFASGWIGVLAEWAVSEDQQLSLLAGLCLANLDRDEHSNPLYGRHVLPLYPTHRVHYPKSVDVVFVHGLLGGVLSTWRQRSRDSFEEGLYELQKEDDITVDTRRQHSSDEHTEEYLRAMAEMTVAEWDQLGSDFEFVVSDFPVDSTAHPSGSQYTFSGKDAQVRQDGCDLSSTQCWPRDWFSRDCPSVRVLGIDYESRLSEWFPTCSEKFRVRTLEERSGLMLEELRKSGIGKRPTVWIAHSMGGLLVKKMLTDALSSGDPKIRSIALNSKAIVFLSTPHLGCPLAKLNDILNYLLWPSTEVEELRHNSQVLNELHKQFYIFLSNVDVKIVTFGEAKSTRTLGVDIHIVPPEFSHFDVGDQFQMPCDHACVAKPYNSVTCKVPGLYLDLSITSDVMPGNNIDTAKFHLQQLSHNTSTILTSLNSKKNKQDSQHLSLAHKFCS